MHLNFSAGCNLSSLYLWDGTWTCAPGFLPVFLVPHPHTFPIASCKCKGQTEKGKKATSLEAYLTWFCTMHALNESTAKDVLCPHWKCSLCSSPWSEIPLPMCLYFCGIQTVWGRDRQKGCKEGWSDSVNAWFSPDLHNEVIKYWWWYTQGLSQS